MAVEYDLIILGGTPLGRTVALAAAQYQARVALVEPPTTAGWTADLAFHTLRRLGQNWPEGGDPGFLEAPAGALELARQRTETLQESPSLAQLHSLGVDVLEGDATFSPRPGLALCLGERVLRSRTYLLLRPRRTLLPSIPGLDNAHPLVPEDLWMSDLWSSPPRQVMVLGGEAAACELAQLLARFGHRVTLIAETALLPEQEPGGARLLQAVLEADGVTVVAPTPIERIWMEAGRAQVQTVMGAIAGDLLLATGPILPDVGALNVGAIGLKLIQGCPETNARLQTSEPRIYACNTLTNAQIALKNALFIPIFRVPADRALQVIFTDPPLVSFGLTQAQVQQRYGSRHYALKQDFWGQPKAHIWQRTTGLCHVWVSPRGHILGGYILGPEAEEWGGLLLLAHRQRIPLQRLAQVPLPNPSFAAGVGAIAQSFQAQQLAHHPRLQRRLDHWFDARRSWMR